MFTADATLVWSGPGQFLVLDHAEPIDDPAAALRTAFAGTASVVDQSHGRVEIEVAGRQARAMLAKLCSLDLAAPAFAVGAAAATSIDHTNVTLWREPDDSDGPVFRFLVFSTFAESLWHLFTASAAEFGAAKGLPVIPVATSNAVQHKLFLTIRRFRADIPQGQIVCLSSKMAVGTGREEA